MAAPVDVPASPENDVLLFVEAHRFHRTTFFFMSIPPTNFPSRLSGLCPQNLYLLDFL